MTLLLAHPAVEQPCQAFAAQAPRSGTTAYQIPEDALRALLDGQLVIQPTPSLDKSSARAAFVKTLAKSFSGLRQSEAEIIEFCSSVYSALCDIPAENVRHWSPWNEAAQQACINVCREYFHRWHDIDGIAPSNISRGWRHIGSRIDDYAAELNAQEHIPIRLREEILNFCVMKGVHPVDALPIYDQLRQEHDFPHSCDPWTFTFLLRKVLSIRFRKNEAPVLPTINPCQTSNSLTEDPLPQSQPGLPVSQAHAFLIRREIAAATAEQRSIEGVVRNLSDVVSARNIKQVTTTNAWSKIYADRARPSLDPIPSRDEFIAFAGQLLIRSPDERLRMLAGRYPIEAGFQQAQSVYAWYFQQAFGLTLESAFTSELAALSPALDSRETVTPQIPTPKPPSDTPTQYIRRRMAAAFIGRHVNAEIFRTTMDQLSTELPSQTPAQLQAAISWMDIYADLILKKASIPISFSTRLVALACRLVLAQASERDALLSSEKFPSVFPDTAVRACLQEYLHKAFGLNWDQENPDALQAKLPCRPAQPAKEVQDAGVHFDYDNPIKTAWRQAAEDFIRKACQGKTLAEFLGPDRGVSLPSIRPVREAEMYERLGVAPGQIIGVEWSDSKADQALFEERARNAGFEPRLSALSTMLMEATHRKEVHRLGNFDFTGQLSAPVADAIAYMHCPQSGRFLLMVNTFAMRERMRTQEVMREVHVAGQVMRETAGIRLEQAQVALRSGQTTALLHLPESHVSDAPLPEVRDQAGDFMLLSAGLGHSAYASAFSEQILALLPELPLVGRLTNIRRCFDMVGADITETVMARPLAFVPKLPGINSAYSPTAFRSVQWPKDLGELAFHTCFSRPFLTGLERWQYLSPPKNRRFHSSFAEFEVPSSLYETLQESAHFVARCSLAFLKAKTDPENATKNVHLEFTIEDKRSRTLGVHERVPDNSRCIANLVVGNTSRPVARVAMNALHSQLPAFTVARDRYSLSKLENFIAVPRNEIPVN